LTIARQEINLVLEVPNKVSKELYLKKIADILFPEELEVEEVHNHLFVKGKIEEVAKFIEEIIGTLSNRDYIYDIKEIGYKVIFLTAFYRVDLYLIESEPEIVRGYADLLYIVRSDQRSRGLIDFIVEFKYIALKEFGKKASDLRKLSKDEIMANKLVKQRLEEAKDQLLRYDEALKQKHPKLSFRKYLLLGVGFERVIGIEIRPD